MPAPPEALPLNLLPAPNRHLLPGTHRCRLAAVMPREVLGRRRWGGVSGRITARSRFILPFPLRAHARRRRRRAKTAREIRPVLAQKEQDSVFPSLPSPPVYCPTRRPHLEVVEPQQLRDDRRRRRRRRAHLFPEEGEGG